MDQIDWCSAHLTVVHVVSPHIFPDGRRRIVEISNSLLQRRSLKHDSGQRHTSSHCLAYSYTAEAIPSKTRECTDVAGSVPSAVCVRRPPHPFHYLRLYSFDPSPSHAHWPQPQRSRGLRDWSPTVAVAERKRYPRDLTPHRQHLVGAQGRMALRPLQRLSSKTKGG